MMMKKLLIASLFVVLALGLFAGVASAKSNQASTQVQMGPLHEYMEKALAAKLNLPLATVESEFDAGKSLYQIALDHGITQANVQAFMLEVRTQAIKAAVADGVITQTQADRMLQQGGRGMGTGMMNGNAGNCHGTGIRAGGGMMQRGGRWGQTNP
jgi:hypothetical protein